MNGFGLLIYVLAVGQIGNTGRPPAFPNLPVNPAIGASASPNPTLPKLGAFPASSSSVDATIYDYGWDIDQDGSLYYIMQIAPDEAQHMIAEGQQVNSEGTEKFSNMPHELIGRIARIAVRVGNQALPRHPSLQEISRRPLLNAAAVAAELDQVIGQGDRLATVDPTQPVVNVQGQSSWLSDFNNQNRAPPPDLSARARGGNQPPALPSSSSSAANAGGAYPSAGGNSYGSAATGNLGDAFLSATAGGQFLDPQSKFQNASDPTASPGVGAGNSGSWSAGDPRSLQGGLAGDARNSQSGGAGPTPGYGYSNPTAGTYPDQGRQQTPAPGFGSTTGSVPSSINDRLSQLQPGYEGYQGYSGVGQSQFPTGQGYTGQGYTDQDLARLEQARRDQLVNDAAAGAAARLAMNSGLPKTFPSTEQTSLKQNEADSSSDRKLNSEQGATSAGPAQSADGIIKVLFLLSLVVNFYLGTLIRKLLSRYRVVSAKVRSQTA